MHLLVCMMLNFIYIWLSQKSSAKVIHSFHQTQAAIAYCPPKMDNVHLKRNSPLISFFFLLFLSTFR